MCGRSHALSSDIKEARDRTSTLRDWVVCQTCLSRAKPVLTGGCRWVVARIVCAMQACRLQSTAPRPPPVSSTPRPGERGRELLLRDLGTRRLGAAYTQCRWHARLPSRWHPLQRLQLHS